MGHGRRGELGWSIYALRTGNRLHTWVHRGRKLSSRTMCLKVVDEIMESFWGREVWVLLREAEEHLHVRDGFGHLEKIQY